MRIEKKINPNNLYKIINGTYFRTIEDNAPANRYLLKYLYSILYRVF
jgi:hypothetical protein